MSDVTHAYVGRAPCGCGLIVFVDRLDVVVDTAEEIRDAQNDGFEFERVLIADARNAVVPCGTPICPYAKSSEQVEAVL